MTDPAIIAASYNAEKSYTHNLDDILDPSGAVFAIGTEKVDTTTLKDRSFNGNDATIKGAMPTEGFIQGRRFTPANKNYIVGSTSITGFPITMCALFSVSSYNYNTTITSLNDANSASRYINLSISREGIQPIQYSIRGGTGWAIENGVDNTIYLNILYHVEFVIHSNTEREIYINGIKETMDDYNNISATFAAGIDSTLVGLLRLTTPVDYGRGLINSVIHYNRVFSELERKQNFNTLARLPFWSVSYTDYPNDATEYTDNLPYSSSIINSGTFKVDADVLNCVSAGTMTYSASYAFDGSEWIKVTIDGVEYAGTGTITHDNTTVSVAQGSNKVTIQMDTGNTIDKIGITFRKEV